MGQGLFFCDEDNWHSTACIHIAIFPYSPKHDSCTLPWPMPSSSHSWVMSEKVLAAPSWSCAGEPQARIWWWDMLWPYAVCRLSRPPLETFPVWALQRKVAPAPQLPTSSLEEVTWSWVLLRLCAVHPPGCGISQVVSRPVGPQHGRTVSPCLVQPRGAELPVSLPHLQQHLLFSTGSRRRLQRGVIRLPELSSSPSSLGPDA